MKQKIFFCESVWGIGHGKKKKIRSQQHSSTQKRLDLSISSINDK
jgi:hypothetical protein